MRLLIALIALLATTALGVGCQPSGGNLTPDDDDDAQDPDSDGYPASVDCDDADRGPRATTSSNG